MIFSLLLLAQLGFAKINVVVTLPEVAQIAQSIGGDKVSVRSLLSGLTDPHYTDAKPSYILAARDADILCFIGLDLESGWLPKVIEKAANPKIALGAPGHCDLGKVVDVIDKPSGKTSRAEGHFHSQGNPHYNISLLRLTQVARGLGGILAKVDSANASHYLQQAQALSKNFEELHQKLKAEVSKGPVLQYHQEFSYFFADYGIENLGSLEEKPGLPPSLPRIAAVADLAKKKKVRVLLANPQAPKASLEKFSELSGIPYAIVPSYLPQGQKIEDLQQQIIKAIPESL